MRSAVAGILIAVGLIAGSILHGVPSAMAMPDCPMAVGQMDSISADSCDSGPMMTAECLAWCGIVWAGVATVPVAEPAVSPQVWVWSDEDQSGVPSAPAIGPPRS
jgi:hypothetical protein